MRSTEIARVAMQLFARRGHAGTSMREIAEAVHLTKSALYHHFPDKDTLYREAMACSIQALHAGIAAAAEGITDPIVRVRTLVHAHLDLFATQRDLIRALYHGLLTPDLPVRAAEPLEVEPLLNALGACADAGHLETERVGETYLLLKGAIELSGVRWLLYPGTPRPTRALGDRLLETAVPSLRGKLADRRGRRRSMGSALGAWIACVLSVVSGPVHAETNAPTIVTAIPGQAVALDLRDCLDAALERNAALLADREGRRELSGQRLQAASTALPTVELVSSWARSRDPSFALDETFGGPDTSSFVIAPEDIPAQDFWRASVNARWELNPLRIWNALGAVRIGTERQEALIQSAEHRTAEATLTAYYGVIRDAEALGALEAELAARQEFLEITKRRFQVEFATALDTLQAAVSLANLAPEKRRATLALVTAGEELNVLMGRAPETPLSIRAELEIEETPVSIDRAVLLSAERPSVKSLALWERIQAKNRGAEKAAHRPYLSLDGQYGYVARRLEDLGDDGKDFWRASVALTVPIFDGFATKGRARQVEAEMLRARLEKIEAQRRARQESRELAGELGVARANLGAAELNMQRANDALEATTLRYENGKADYLAVLNAQSDRFQARSNLIEARYEVLTTTASLKRAMGVSPAAPLRDVFGNGSR